MILKITGVYVYGCVGVTVKYFRLLATSNGLIGFFSIFGTLPTEPWDKYWIDAEKLVILQRD